MYLPKGNILYENLNTSFTNFEELLLNLRGNSMTGYVRISFWQYEGVLFIDTGNVINAREEFDHQITTGQEAVNGILAKAKEKDGTIGVYRLSPDMVTILAGAAKSEIVYKDLTSDFTNLEKLIEKLKNEQHTGFIEILTKDGRYTAIIFVQAGEPIESILSTDGKVVSNGATLTEIFKFVNHHEAIFNVHKAGLSVTESYITTHFDTSQLINFWGDIIATIEHKFEPGKFLMVFKNILINKADNFPFLDPFASEFNYNAGKITFEGNVPAHFSKGIGEVLQEIMIQISDPNVHNEIKAIMDAKREVVEKYSLEDIMNNILK